MFAIEMMSISAARAAGQSRFIAKPLTAGSFLTTGICVECPRLCWKFTVKLGPSIPRHRTDMDGLVAYSDSEDEEQQQGNAQQQQEQQQSGLPQSAAGSVGKLPPPDFGPQPGTIRSQLPPAAQLPLGSKRGHPDTRGPQLPNPMADSKLQRGYGCCRFPFGCFSCCGLSFDFQECPAHPSFT